MRENLWRILVVQENLWSIWCRFFNHKWKLESIRTHEDGSTDVLRVCPRCGDSYTQTYTRADLAAATHEQL